MNGILEMLKTPAFWFGTVIVGVLINIASHFLIQRWGGWVSKISKTWATRTTKLKQEREDAIIRLVNNTQEQNFYTTKATHMRIISVFYLLLSLLTTCYQIQGLALLSLEVTLKMEHSRALIFFILSVFCLLFFILAMERTLSANNLVDVVEEARSRKQSRQENI